jgi:hypothetical protein
MPCEPDAGRYCICVAIAPRVLELAGTWGAGGEACDGRHGDRIVRSTLPCRAEHRVDERAQLLCRLW